MARAVFCMFEALDDGVVRRAPHFGLDRLTHEIAQVVADLAGSGELEVDDDEVAVLVDHQIVGPPVTMHDRRFARYLFQEERNQPREAVAEGDDLGRTGGTYR